MMLVLKHNLKLLIFGIIMAVSASGYILFFYNNNADLAQAQTASVQTDTGKDDGIAARVMPNNDHLNPLAWYKKNIKQQGSPSSLKVDGYEAVQEGRTVYVNAGNVSGTDLFTNIYIISYTQDAGGDTQNIFKQLLDNWIFNTNIIADAQVGQCMQIKNNNWEAVKDKKCYTDFQCDAGMYCDSAKAKITRDVRRLADLQIIKTAMENYKSKNKKYPDLAAGSYLAGKTISVWPSWQKTLGKELGITLPADPINKLVGCDDPNKDGTCWHETEKRFGDLDGTALKHSIPDKLPADIYIYAYTATGGVCAVMETNYTITQEFKCK
ncbi:MAG: hypothetical protein WCV41_02485 [Patescibacteria group bacterium]